MEMAPCLLIVVSSLLLVYNGSAEEEHHHEMALCLLIVVSSLSRPSHDLTMMSCKHCPLSDVFVRVHAPVSVCDCACDIFFSGQQVRKHRRCTGRLRSSK